MMPHLSRPRRRDFPLQFAAARVLYLHPCNGLHVVRTCTCHIAVLLDTVRNAEAVAVCATCLVRFCFKGCCGLHSMSESSGKTFMVQCHAMMQQSRPRAASTKSFEYDEASENLGTYISCMPRLAGIDPKPTIKLCYGF